MCNWRVNVHNFYRMGFQHQNSCSRLLKIMRDWNHCAGPPVDSWLPFGSPARVFPHNSMWRLLVHCLTALETLGYSSMIWRYRFRNSFLWYFSLRGVKGFLGWDIVGRVFTAAGLHRSADLVSGQCLAASHSWPGQWVTSPGCRLGNAPIHSAEPAPWKVTWWVSLAEIESSRA